MIINTPLSWHGARNLSKAVTCSGCGETIGVSCGTQEAAAQIMGTNDYLCYRCMYIAPDERGPDGKSEAAYAKLRIEIQRRKDAESWLTRLFRRLGL